MKFNISIHLVKFSPSSWLLKLIRPPMATLRRRQRQVRALQGRAWLAKGRWSWGDPLRFFQETHKSMVVAFEMVISCDFIRMNVEFRTEEDLKVSWVGFLYGIYIYGYLIWFHPGWFVATSPKVTRNDGVNHPQIIVIWPRFWWRARTNSGK